MDIKRRGFLKALGIGAATAPALLKTLAAQAKPIQVDPKRIGGFKRTLIRIPVTNENLIKLSIDHRRKWIHIDNDFVNFLPVHRHLSNLMDDAMYGSKSGFDITERDPTSRITDGIWMMNEGWRIVNPERMRGACHGEQEWVDVLGIREEDEAMVHVRCEKCSKHGTPWRFMPYTSMRMCKHAVEFRGINPYGRGTTFTLATKHDGRRLNSVVALSVVVGKELV